MPSAVFSAIIFQDDFNKANQALLGRPQTLVAPGRSLERPSSIRLRYPATKYRWRTPDKTRLPFSNVVPNAAGFPIRTRADINLSAVGAGDYFFHLTDPVGSSSLFFQRLGAVATSGGYFFTLAVTSGTGARNDHPGTTVLSLGTTYHVDIDWNFVSGASMIRFKFL